MTQPNMNAENIAEVQVDELEEVMKKFRQLVESTGLHFSHLSPLEAMNAGARFEELVKSSFIAGKRKANLENLEIINSQRSQALAEAEEVVRAAVADYENYGSHSLPKLTRQAVESYLKKGGE